MCVCERRRWNKTGSQSGRQAGSSACVRACVRRASCVACGLAIRSNSICLSVSKYVSYVAQRSRCVSKRDGKTPGRSVLLLPIPSSFSSLLTHSVCNVYSPRVTRTDGRTDGKEERRRRKINKTSAIWSEQASRREREGRERERDQTERS